MHEERSVTFLGRSAGFYATLKAKLNHFVVDEISNFEAWESANSSNKSLHSNEVLGLKRKADQDSSVTSKQRKIDATSCNEPANEIRFKCDLAWCETFLQKKLFESVFSNLQKLCEIDADAHVNESQGTPLILGTFPCKLDRLLLHRSVSYLFPHLKTITTPHSDTITADVNQDFEKFRNLIGVEQTNNLLRFVQVERPEKYKNSVTLEGNYSKETRRQIHHLIGSTYGKFVETKTSGGNGGVSRIVVRTKQYKHSKNAIQNKDGDEDEITAFTLWKKNTETHSAIQQLSSHLQLRPHMFKFAGIKDKRAITTQCCTVTGISAERFEEGCESLPNHLKVSDIRPVSRAIRLGELIGNHFMIRLSNVRALKRCENEQNIKQIVETALEEVKVTGFVNYFGPQRFGREIPSSGSIPLDDKCYVPTTEAPVIGLAMLKGDFKRAVEILLSPVKSMTSSGVNEAEEAKLYFQSTGDIAGTLERMPKHKMREISILRTLRRYGTTENHAYVKALMGLTHSARLFYVHSFCSWIWNEIAALRIRRYGQKVVPGDLALEENPEISSDNLEVNKKDVFVVSDEDVSLNRVNLNNIVLSVPGNQVIYPPNLDEEYMKYLGVSGAKSNADTSSVESLNFRIPDLKLNAPGTYRKLIEFPLNLSYKFLGFHEFSPTDDKINEDLANTIECEENEDEIKGIKAEMSSVQESPSVANLSSMTIPIGLDSSSANSENVDVSNASGDFEQRPSDSKSVSGHLPVCDVELKFDLPPSCYATTFISELTKGNMNC